MPEFGLIKSFDIDHGELEGLRPQDCFVLGYELAMVDEALKRPGPLSTIVHAENHARIVKSCTDAKRRYLLVWCQGDKSESWLQLEVAPLSESRPDDQGEEAGK